MSTMLWSSSAVALVFLGLVSFGAGPGLREGDVIFQTSRSSQSQAIQRATHSKWSHVGVIVLRDGRPWVLEAVATVRETPLDHWVARGRGGHYVVKRLVKAHRWSGAASTSRMRSVERTLSGKPYDTAFAWSDERQYCSELVWKVYERALGVRLCEPQKLRDFDLRDPVVATKLRERYGDRVPLGEPVVSPAALFDSPMLRTVVSR